MTTLEWAKAKRKQTHRKMKKETNTTEYLKLKESYKHWHKVVKALENEVE